MKTNNQYSQNGTDWIANNQFTENISSYDLNSNILSMTRCDNGTSSTRNYNYIGNKLQSLSDVSGNYLYDPNGNMKKDARKACNLEYNVLTLRLSERNANLFVFPNVSKVESVSCSQICCPK